MSENRNIFGIPAVLVSSEVHALTRGLSELWAAAYGQPLGSLTTDIELCRRYFDPLSRGNSIRERLAQLGPASAVVRRDLAQYGEPLVMRVDDTTMLVGVEARLVLDLLRNAEGDHAVLSTSDINVAQGMALEFYRGLSTARLRQTLDLRAGRGREVMQAISVGLTVALLINRSDSRSRAISQRDPESVDGADVDTAIFAGAERFADVIAGSRGSRRAVSEQKLKSGYALTEAKRRLAHRLVIERMKAKRHSLIFIPAEYRSEVVDYLGRDLARRAGLTADTLGVAFDQLLHAFQGEASKLAHRSMVFDRPGDTRRLRADLLEAFEKSTMAPPNHITSS